MNPVSVPPASCTIGIPYVFSNSRCFSSDSGAVLDVMKRSVGRSAAVTATGRASSMLMTVGMPTATVTRWSRIQSKKRAGENFLASSAASVALSVSYPPCVRLWRVGRGNQPATLADLSADQLGPKEVHDLSLSASAKRLESLD